VIEKKDDGNEDRGSLSKENWSIKGEVAKLICV
jgi:hypothetical protein